ncbi:protein disulfide isomerase-like 1-4 [Papaver somniferum]|uniref:protein disulfide isomerase-like 1-4 n=1 Tax=Papaver somniferum TaxID=3469 RepID=UPI000E6F569F|nr:protein disulfide isomerase-like 1-4 [Papaver somniferum]
MANRSLYLVSITFLLLINNFCSANAISNIDDDNEEVEGSNEGQKENSYPIVDEKDVIILKHKNFSKTVKKNRYVMVLFYEPWSKEYEAFLPGYASAATELKGEALLAKVDATEVYALTKKYELEEYPSVLFFIDGVIQKRYLGKKTKDAIVAWVKKKSGPGIYNVTEIEDAKRILNTDDKLVMGFFDSLVGPNCDILAAVSRQEDYINFYQTSSPEVAKIFHIDPDVERPALVMLKKEAEKQVHFNGKFTKLAIAKFVSASKLPLVTRFSKESAQLIFENPVKNQIFLFATSSDSVKFISEFEEAARFFKGKIIFIYVELDGEDVGVALSAFFGVNGRGLMVIAYTGTEDAKKYMFVGKVTLDNIKAFGKDFLEGKLPPFYKSDPIPEINDRDVKIVVGKNFDEIVLDESKDVLLEIHAPWCEHCQKLEPTYNELAKQLRGINSIVIAKMDGSTNEHPRVKVEAFPTFFFFRAGNKNSDPITIDGSVSIDEITKYLKEHASIPFKARQKPSSSSPVDVDISKRRKNSDNNNNVVNDEL